MLGKTDGMHNYEWLFESLERMFQCSIETVKTKRYVYKGHLISGYCIDKETGKLNISVNEEYINFLKCNENSYQDVLHRRSLKTDLAKWLYNFYSTQESDQFHKISYLKEIINSNCSDAKFKFSVKEQLTQLKDKGLIKEFKIEKDVVKVTPNKLKYIKFKDDENNTIDISPSPTESIAVALPIKKSTGRGRVSL